MTGQPYSAQGEGKRAIVGKVYCKHEVGCYGE